ncbi:hypothetical protein BKA70DRAFT_1418372 [Coprinopsis sp. MPI-PUGE-AT-0042]|nr:hypothetical protein BKA70DRAFT_1418372 [Coprinopsis sp. MPI-PUGE-AT-0042]
MPAAHALCGQVGVLPLLTAAVADIASFRTTHHLVIAVVSEARLKPAIPGSSLPPIPMRDHHYTHLAFATKFSIKLRHQPPAHVRHDPRPYSEHPHACPIASIPPPSPGRTPRETPADRPNWGAGYPCPESTLPNCTTK